MMDMYVLYLLMLAGSPVFGMEALLLGLKGSLTSIFRGELKLFALSAGIGSVLVCASIGLTHFLSLGELSPLFLCVLVLALTFSSGLGISTIKTRVLARDDLPERGEVSDEEVEEMLRDRGLSGLIDDEGER